MSAIHSYYFNKIKDGIESFIDCDFTINSVELKNFRSVEYLKFLPKEGITLIQGDVGSGKSTLINAIRYVFLDAKDSINLKDLVKLNSKSMSVSIEIAYQGHTHYIERGYAKNSGYLIYKINNKLIESENQSSIKSHISNNLRFLKLFNVFFFNQRREGFLSSYSYSERVSLISDILNLDILDKIYRLVVDDVAKLKNEISLISNEINSKTATINARKEQIAHWNSDIDYQSLIADNLRLISIYSLIIELNEKTESHSKQQQINRKIVESLSDLPQLLSKSTDKTPLLLEKNNLLSLLEESTSELIRRQKLLEKYKNEINKIQLNVDILKKQRDVLKESKCHACGHSLNAEEIESLKQKTDLSISENENRLEKGKKAVESVDIDSVELKNYKIKSLISEIDNKISLILAEEDNFIKQQNNQRKLAVAKDIITTSENQIEALQHKILAVCEEHNVQPINAYQEVMKLKEENAGFNQLLILKNKYQISLEKIEKDEATLKDTQHSLAIKEANLVDLSKYLELFSPKGEILLSILNELSQIFSNNHINVRSIKKLTNGDVRPDFDIDFKVDNEWIKYDMCSGGQQTIIDISILEKLYGILGKVGVLAFDETFKFLGDSDTEQVLQSIKLIDANHVFIISHAQNFPYSDSLIKVDFDKKSIYNVVF